MKFLNGFILIGIILLFISVAGLVSGNTLLTEPGQPTNNLAWLEYLGAAALMLINGAVSIWNVRQNEGQSGGGVKNEKEPEETTTASKV